MPLTRKEMDRRWISDWRSVVAMVSHSPLSAIFLVACGRNRAIALVRCASIALSSSRKDSRARSGHGDVLDCRDNADDRVPSTPLAMHTEKRMPCGFRNGIGKVRVGDRADRTRHAWVEQWTAVLLAGMFNQI